MRSNASWISHIADILFICDGCAFSEFGDRFDMVAITRTGRARTFVELLAQGQIINLQHQGSKFQCPDAITSDPVRLLVCVYRTFSTQIPSVSSKIYANPYSRHNDTFQNFMSTAPSGLNINARRWGRCERVSFHRAMSPGARGA